MIKSIGALLGGVFIGAVAMEVVRRVYPDAMDKLYDGVRKAGSSAKDAFKQGYANATRPAVVVEPGT